MAPSRGGQTSFQHLLQLPDTDIRIRDPARVLDCAHLQRQLGFQYLVRRYLSQILHGCTSTHCITPTCLTCNKRLVNRPHRPPTQLTARALAHFLASQDDPYGGLCPHSLRVSPASLAIEGADGVEYGYSSTRPELWCKTGPIAGLPLSSHAQRHTHLLDRRTPSAYPDVKDSVDPARVLAIIDERHQAKKDLKSLGQNLYDTVAVIYSYSKQLPSAVSVMEIIQTPLSFFQPGLTAQALGTVGHSSTRTEASKMAGERATVSSVREPVLSPSSTSLGCQNYSTSTNRAGTNTGSVQVLNNGDRIQKFQYRPSDNGKSNHALSGIADPSSFDGSQEIRTRRKSVKVTSSIERVTGQITTADTHSYSGPPNEVSESREPTRQEESLISVASHLNASTLNIFKNHVYKHRVQHDQNSVFAMVSELGRELGPTSAFMNRSIFFHLSNAETLLLSFRDSKNPDFENSPLPHLDSTQLSQALRNWDRHNSALLFDSLWHAVQALFIPPPDIDNQKSPRMKASRKGASQSNAHNQPVPDFEQSTSMFERYLNDEEVAHIVIICIHALTSLVSVAWPRTWVQLRHLRSWGIFVPGLAPNSGKDSIGPIDPWLDMIDELEYEPALRLAEALLRGLGARMCFERIVATLAHKDKISDGMPLSSTHSPLVDIIVHHLVEVERAAIINREEPNPKLNFDEDPGWTVTSTFMEWMRTIIIKKWDGKSTVNKWSSVGVSMSLFNRFYAQWNDLNLRPNMFHIPWLPEQIDHAKEPMKFIQWEPQPNISHIFQYLCLFPAEYMISYFRTINFTSMCKQYQHSEQITEIQRHLDTFITQPYLNAMNSRLKLSLSDYFVLQVGRQSILEDTLNQLWGQERRLLLKPLKVKIGASDGEMGHDQGGVTYEFFRLVLEEAFKPDYGMFVVDPETNMTWFQPDSIEPGWKFEMLGMLFSLAVYNGVTLPVTFPFALYHHLLAPNHPHVSMEAQQSTEFIKDGWPMLAKSFDEMLSWKDGDVADIFYRQCSFSYSAFGRTIDINMQHLDSYYEGEEAPLVTNATRAQYVADYISLLTYTTVMPQLLTFRKGFYACLDPKSLHLFSAQSLRNLVEGTQEVDVGAWQANTRYEDGFHPTHKTVIDFWSIVQEYNMEDRRKLLEFVTASDRVPVTGFANMNFNIVRNGPDTESLPTSSTCFGKLMLPEYANKEKMKSKLDIAIQHSKGFGVV